MSNRFFLGNLCLIYGKKIIVKCPHCVFCLFSSDGAIKIWDENKFLMTEVMLEESLSAACFLNDLGDLIVGFKNHIFYIDHAKCKWFSNLLSPRKSKL